MKRIGWAGVIAGCLLGTAFAAYQPKENPLMTVWGEKMTPESAWREYPRPNLVREKWQNLNGLWQYAINKRDAERPEEWAGEILVPFPIESALSGVKRLMTGQEQLWYRRTFTAPVDAKRERLLLHFGAVDFRTQVWVNGEEVTDVPHESGNLPFTLDITDFVQAGENELVLSVWDPTNDQGYYQSLGKQHLTPGGCMYTRVSGIWQTVWLETVPKTHITGYKVVTDIDKGTVAVTVDAAGNLANAQVNLTVKRGNDTVATGSVTAWGEPVVMKIDNPQLWSPEAPNLYDLVISLKAAGSAEDTVKGYFGMRKIEWRKDEKGIPRFYFNNKKLFLQGTLDQGWWPDGLLTPPSDDAMAYDINLLKGCGFNMMRKHIKIEPLRYYYLCDKLGIMIWQDMVSGWGNTEDRYTLYRSELKEMMDLLQTYPSIVIWVPYNESWGQPAKAKTNMTMKWVKRYDPTRLVDGPSGWNDYGVGDTRDMHNYPGPGMFPVMENRVSVLGEFGGIGLAIDGHLWQQKNWGYVSDKTTDASFARYTALMRKLAKLAQSGLAASVYTQTTDVEGEINGLVTYDRKHEKYSRDALKALHKRVYDAALDTRVMVQTPVLPTSEKNAAKWKYTFEKPSASWFEPAFDDAAWKTGEAGFGNRQIAIDHPVAKVRTAWNGSDIWLRRDFTFNGEIPAEVALNIFYDEDTVIYLNGVKIAELAGYNIKYEAVELDQAVIKKTLKQGKNVLAIHTINKGGGAYIDVGFDAISYK
ncbi:MAG: beta galactosidase jelly roll domain-containing protein [Kiritimatiellae bacterium]|nr:beta galactosidase jelly roll domain-containing protein [Kiritimatiellia bacterium]